MEDINYDEIDELCIPLVRFFNEIGLITEFSCQGHDNEYHNDFVIIFNSSITDKQIYDFLERCSYGYDHTPVVGNFLKWARKGSDKIVETWMYQLSYGNHTLNQQLARIDEETFKNGRSTYEN